MATASLRFDGRTAIITGGGRGMGRSHALTLASRGANVVVNDLGTSVQGLGTDPSPANDVVVEIRAAGGAAVANTDDVSTAEGAEAMVNAAIDNFGGLDIVVHNAGIATHKGDFIDVDFEDFMKHVSIHLVGGFNVSHAAWPHLLEHGYGRVVMITSSAALGRRGAVSYGSAKAGMIGLTKSLAQEGREDNIRVNAIAPAAETRMTRESGVRNVTRLPNGEEVPLAPENTSAVVAVLCHDSCPSNGEVFGVGAAHVGRLFIGDTLGYTADGLVLAPEDVMDHWGQVLDERGYYVPLDCTHHSERLRNPSLLTAVSL
jgi:NAD(P)-dependent dehydrogenase (short-subunit alcohol dehydrogenase family)